MTNELKKAIETVKAYLDMDSDVDSEYLNAQRTIIKALESQRWIPCEERLPEEHICDDGYIEPSEYVLIYDDLNYCHVSRYWGNRRNKRDYKDWVDVDLSTRKVIAWMPLPEPYKAESEDAE